MSRVLVIANDYVNRRMAGPAIRAYELSRRLAAAGNQVTLAVPAASDLVDVPFRIEVYDEAALRRLAPASDVIIFQGWVLERFPFIRDGDASLVVDLYDPFPLELLVSIGAEPSEDRLRERTEALLCLNEQVRLGDFFMCASEKQLDFWLGSLHSLNRVNPATYAADPSLKSLIAVVPFGIPSEVPRRQGPGPRELVPGIGPNDLLLLWGGGVYNWFDPLTLIEGVMVASRTQPSVRLCFMATDHPNPDVPEMRMLTEARRLAKRVDPDGRHVFFNREWIPYENRADWLLDADIGVSTHFDHVETRFSFRTRVLDYFWAGLPVITTAGDALAGRIDRERLGRTVAAEDPHAVARAVEELADPRERSRVAARVRRHAREYTWDVAVQPLISFCAKPWRAPDLIAGVAPPVPVRIPALPAPVIEAPTADGGLGRLVRRGAEVIIAEGPVAAVRKGAGRIRRRLRRE